MHNRKGETKGFFKEIP